MSVDPRLFTELDKPLRISVEIRLVNMSSHDITVLTSQLNWGYSIQTGQTDLDLKADVGTWNDPMTARPVMGSIYDHSPVALRPGEMAETSYVMDSILKTDAEGEDYRVRVTYKVDGEMARRAGVWHGELVSDFVPVRLHSHLSPALLNEVRKAPLAAIVTVSNIHTNGAVITCDAVVERRLKGKLPDKIRIKDAMDGSYLSMIKEGHSMLACLKPAGEYYSPCSRNSLRGTGKLDNPHSGIDCTALEQALKDIADIQKKQ